MSSQTNLLTTSTSSRTGRQENTTRQIFDEVLSEIVDKAFAQLTLREYQKKQHPFMTPERGKNLATRPLENTPSKMIYPDKRPDWWDSTHRHLRQIAQRNQEKPLRGSDIEPIRKVAAEIIDRTDPIQSMMFLKLLSEFIFMGAKRIFFDVLNALRKSHPEIEPYFADTDTTDDPDEGPVFTSLAIDRIFQFFEDEYGYPQGALSSQPVSSLPSLISQMMTSGRDGDICGYVITNDRMPEDPHVVPVFLLKDKGETHVFLFDSVGHTFSRDRFKLKISAALEELIDHYKQAKDPAALPLIYSYQIKRQNSDLGCSTFATLDLKNLLERHLHRESNLVDFYKSQDDAIKPRLATQELDPDLKLPIYELTTLPPEMMKVTQSLTKLDSYHKSSPSDPCAPFVERFTPSWDTCFKIKGLNDLASSVADVVRVDPRGGAKNLYVEQKRLQFAVYLLSVQFQTGFSSPSGLATNRRLFAEEDPAEEMKGAPRRQPRTRLPMPLLPGDDSDDDGDLLTPPPCRTIDSLPTSRSSVDSPRPPIPSRLPDNPNLDLMSVSDFEDED